MKSFIILFAFITVLCLRGDLMAQDSQASSDKVAAALARSDARTLGDLLAERIDMELPSSDGIYSRTQASLILKDFFREHPAQGFTVKHSGSSGEGAAYTIGTYLTAGKSFRVYYLMKRSGAAYYVNQLRFEPEN